MRQHLYKSTKWQLSQEKSAKCGPWKSSHVLCKNVLRTGKSDLELGAKLSNWITASAAAVYCEVSQQLGSKMADFKV